jgi:FkbM family methyltransferase
VTGALLFLLSVSVALTGYVIYFLLIRNGELLLRIQRGEPFDFAQGKPSSSGARSLRLFGHLAWRNRFELENIVAPIICRNEYSLGRERFDASDVIIDVGAHIGAFATVCHTRGSRSIFCYEPDESNYELLERNIGHLPGVHLARVAVWRSDMDGAVSDLILSGPAGDNTGASSVVATGRMIDYATQTIGELAATARRVRAVGLDDILAGFDRVNLLKLDCEGSEFPILLTSRQLHKVDRIVGEVHELEEPMMKRLDPACHVQGLAAYRVETLVHALESQRFQVHIQPTSPHLFIITADRLPSPTSAGASVP